MTAGDRERHLSKTIAGCLVNGRDFWLIVSCSKQTGDFAPCLLFWFGGPNILYALLAKQ